MYHCILDPSLTFTVIYWKPYWKARNYLFRLESLAQVQLVWKDATSLWIPDRPASPADRFRVLLHFYRCASPTSEPNLLSTFGCWWWIRLKRVTVICQNKTLSERPILPPGEKFQHCVALKVGLGLCKTKRNLRFFSKFNQNTVRCFQVSFRRVSGVPVTLWCFTNFLVIFWVFSGLSKIH